ncbi:MAG: hypothetical protein IJX91_03205 [Clostridia bacterium]|nr:hypothetical protein [Clostridia bacterium]
MGVNAFIYTPEEMPDEEVTVVQRLSDILNKRYTTDTVDNSLEFLLEETIQVYWNNDKSQDPFVGSMGETYADEIAELFGDVLTEESNVSFILKNQDLNGDGYNEIAMYSTSDTLDNSSSSYEGVVCVYVTVFTPTVNSLGQVIGYEQVCESLRGYCYEIYYSPSYKVPSFSTDTWLDSVGYTRNNQNTELPEDAQLDYDQYNLSYRPSGSWRSYTTKPMGDSLSVLLQDRL